MAQPRRVGEGVGPAAVAAGYRAAAWLLRRLPEGVAEAVVGAGAFGAAVLSGRRGVLVARHVSLVTGEPLDQREARRWVRRVYASYGRYWLEGARLPGTPGGVIEARMRVEQGFEGVTEAVDSGRGAIVALPHVGSWEWGGAWLAVRGYPMTAVAEELQPASLQRWFVAQREALGLHVVPLGPSAGRSVLGVLRKGGLVGLVCDRDIIGDGVEVEFFGERTTLPAGPAMLALRTGAALFPTAVYSGPGRLHTAVVLPELPVERRGRVRDDVARITQDLARSLEGLIARAPEQWHCLQPNWPSERAGSPGGEGTR